MPPQGSINITVNVNVSGLVTEEALALIREHVDQAITQAIDEARRMATGVKRS